MDEAPMFDPGSYQQSIDPAFDHEAGHLAARENDLASFETSQSLVNQSIAEIEQRYPVCEPSSAASVATPEASSSASASASPMAVHGATGPIEPVAAAVADVKQTVTAGPPLAPEVAGDDEAEASGQAAAGATTAKPTWTDRARAYNRRNAKLVEQFDQATGGECAGDDGEVDPTKVSRWQAGHGLAPDGRVGPLTAAAARSHGQAKPETINYRTLKPERDGLFSEKIVGPAPEPAAAEATATATPEAAPASKPAAPPAAATDPGKLTQLIGQYGGLLKQFVGGVLDQAQVIEKWLAFDKQLHGGSGSTEALAMVPALLDALIKIATSQAKAPAQGQAPGGKPPVVPVVPPAPGEPFKQVIDVTTDSGTQKCLVFASPGGVTATPNVFIFFHGHDAQYGIDPAQAKKKGSASGSDVAGEAMTHARGKNTIAILPQGVVGGSIKGTSKGRSAEGGHMKALQDGLPAFLASVFGQVGPMLGAPGMQAGNISIAGHSAGGYQGVHDALEGAGELLDQITDLTLMDSSYSTAHFSDALDWILQGKPGKSLRIIGSPKQIGGGKHAGYFGKSALGSKAGKKGFTVMHLPVKGDERENKTRAVQHSQLLSDGGGVHADILILEAKRGHHDIRDDVMDDAILSIGEGAAGSDNFAREDPEQTAQVVEQQKPEAAVGLEYLHELISSFIPGGPAQVPGSEEHHDDKVEHEPHDGLVQPHLEDKAGGLVEQGGGKTDASTAAWIHDTKSATSTFPAELAALYDDCVSRAKKGTLCFPGDDGNGRSSAPLIKFKKALYQHFHYGERRINKEITGKGGKKMEAFYIVDYLHSLQAKLPSEHCAPGKAGLRCHYKAAEAFAAMHEAAKADGVDIRILSAFREPKNKKSSKPQAVASNSSHSYGLALDLRLSVDHEGTDDDLKVSEVSTSISTKQSKTNFMDYYKSSVTKWMLVNGARFNFFPYQNEPWHYEYNPEGMAQEIIDGAKAFKK